MKKNVIFRLSGLGLALGLVCGCAGMKWSVSNKSFDLKNRLSLNAEDIIIEIPDKSLSEGQILTFKVQWLGVSVGKVTTSVKGIQNINGRNAYVLEAIFQSNAFLSSIYKIEDRYVSYLDVEKLHTLRQEVYRRDGKYKKDAITEFDQEKHKARFKNFIDNSEKDFDIPENVLDALSALYYFMVLPLKGGDKIELAVCNNESNYQLLGVVESRAFIKTPGTGQKRAFLIQPYAKLEGEKVEKGNLKAYFSCDKKRILLLAVLQGPIFTEVSVVLSQIDNPALP